MDAAERIPSPDGAYAVFLISVEMRMSHRLAQPRIAATATNRTVLDLTEGLWSADAVRWSHDSARVALDLRRYPGDAPGLTATIALRAGTAAVISPTDTVTPPLDALPEWLEGYYERHRWA